MSDTMSVVEDNDSITQQPQMVDQGGSSPINSNPETRIPHQFDFYPHQSPYDTTFLSKINVANKGLLRSQEFESLRPSDLPSFDLLGEHLQTSLNLYKTASNPGLTGYKESKKSIYDIPEVVEAVNTYLQQMEEYEEAVKQHEEENKMSDENKMCDEDQQSEFTSEMLKENVWIKIKKTFELHSSDGLNHGILSDFTRKTNRGGFKDLALAPGRKPADLNKKNADKKVHKYTAPNTTSNVPIPLFPDLTKGLLATKINQYKEFHDTNDLEGYSTHFMNLFESPKLTADLLLALHNSMHNAQALRQRLTHQHGINEFSFDSRAFWIAKELLMRTLHLWTIINEKIDFHGLDMYQFSLTITWMMQENSILAWLESNKHPELIFDQNDGFKQTNQIDDESLQFQTTIPKISIFSNNSPYIHDYNPYSAKLSMEEQRQIFNEKYKFDLLRYGDLETLFPPVRSITNTNNFHEREPFEPKSLYPPVEPVYNHFGGSYNQYVAEIWDHVPFQHQPKIFQILEKIAYETSNGHGFTHHPNYFNAQYPNYDDLLSLDPSDIPCMLKSHFIEKVLAEDIKKFVCEEVARIKEEKQEKEKKESSVGENDLKSPQNEEKDILTPVQEFCQKRRLELSRDWNKHLKSLGLDLNGPNNTVFYSKLPFTQQWSELSHKKNINTNKISFIDAPLAIYSAMVMLETTMFQLWWSFANAFSGDNRTSELMYLFGGLKGIFTLFLSIPNLPSTVIDQILWTLANFLGNGIEQINQVFISTRLFETLSHRFLSIVKFPFCLEAPRLSLLSASSLSSISMISFALGNIIRTQGVQSDDLVKLTGLARQCLLVLMYTDWFDAQVQKQLSSEAFIEQRYTDKHGRRDQLDDEHLTELTRELRSVQAMHIVNINPYSFHPLTRYKINQYYSTFSSSVQPFSYLHPDTGLPIVINTVSSGSFICRLPGLQTPHQFDVESHYSNENRSGAFEVFCNNSGMNKNKNFTKMDKYRAFITMSNPIDGYIHRQSENPLPQYIRFYPLNDDMCYIPDPTLDMVELNNNRQRSPRIDTFEDELFFFRFLARNADFSEEDTFKKCFTPDIISLILSLASYRGYSIDPIISGLSELGVYETCEVESAATPYLSLFQQLLVSSPLTIRQGRVISIPFKSMIWSLSNNSAASEKQLGLYSMIKTNPVILQYLMNVIYTTFSLTSSHYTSSSTPLQNSAPPSTVKNQYMARALTSELVTEILVSYEAIHALKNGQYIAYVPLTTLLHEIQYLMFNPYHQMYHVTNTKLLDKRYYNFMAPGISTIPFLALNYNYFYTMGKLCATWDWCGIIIKKHVIPDILGGIFQLMDWFKWLINDMMSGKVEDENKVKIENVIIDKSSAMIPSESLQSLQLSAPIVKPIQRSMCLLYIESITRVLHGFCSAMFHTAKINSDFEVEQIHVLNTTNCILDLELFQSGLHDEDSVLSKVLECEEDTSENDVYLDGITERANCKHLLLQSSSSSLTPAPIPTPNDDISIMTQQCIESFISLLKNNITWEVIKTIEFEVPDEKIQVYQDDIVSMINIPVIMDHIFYQVENIQKKEASRYKKALEQYETETQQMVVAMETTQDKLTPDDQLVETMIDNQKDENDQGEEEKKETVVSSEGQGENLGQKKLVGTKSATSKKSRTSSPVNAIIDDGAPLSFNFTLFQSKLNQYNLGHLGKAVPCDVWMKIFGLEDLDPATTTTTTMVDDDFTTANHTSNLSKPIPSPSRPNRLLIKYRLLWLQSLYPTKETPIINSEQIPTPGVNTYFEAKRETHLNYTALWYQKRQLLPPPVFGDDQSVVRDRLYFGSFYPEKDFDEKDGCYYYENNNSSNKKDDNRAHVEYIGIIEDDDDPHSGGFFFPQTTTGKKKLLRSDPTTGLIKNPSRVNQPIDFRPYNMYQASFVRKTGGLHDVHDSTFISTRVRSINNSNHDKQVARLPPTLPPSQNSASTPLNVNIPIFTDSPSLQFDRLNLITQPTHGHLVFFYTNQSTQELDNLYQFCSFDSLFNFKSTPIQPEKRFIPAIKKSFGLDVTDEELNDANIAYENGLNFGFDDDTGLTIGSDIDDSTPQSTPIATKSNPFAELGQHIKTILPATFDSKSVKQLTNLSNTKTYTSINPTLLYARINNYDNEDLWDMGFNHVPHTLLQRDPTEQQHFTSLYSNTLDHLVTQATVTVPPDHCGMSLLDYDKKCKEIRLNEPLSLPSTFVPFIPNPNSLLITSDIDPQQISNMNDNDSISTTDHPSRLDYNIPIGIELKPEQVLTLPTSKIQSAIAPLSATLPFKLLVTLTNIFNSTDVNMDTLRSSYLKHE